MSFILDALKKSEHERQRQTIPGLVESSVARPKPRLPVWAIALCALLGINLLVLLFVLLRGWMAPGQTPAAIAPARGTHTRAAEAPDTDSSDTDAADDAGTDPAPRKTAPRMAAATAPGAAERPFSPLDGSSVYAPEIPVAAGTAPATVPAASVRAPATADGMPERAVRRRDPVLTNNDYKAADDEVLPSINELNLTGAQALPELHLDVHVFATRPADRFVFINMRKYHEGATMQEGPTVERIRRDGVILDYQGLRFMMPRQ
jgi:general secretion pathway protein B